MGIVMSKLLILGAGQYGKVAREIAEAMGSFEVISFLDDNSSTAIGNLCDYDKFSDEYDTAIVAIGDPELRLGLLQKLKEFGYIIPILVHPKAYISPSSVIENGSFVEPMAIVHTDVKIGAGCIISAGTIVNHNAVIGCGCHLNCGTIIGARAVIKELVRTNCGQIIE